MAARKDQAFLDFVLDQLAGLGRITWRRMFGGIGLYQAGTFFAVIDDGRLYFVTDARTRPAFEAKGMGPFEYAPGKVLRNYWEVPLDVLEDDAELCEWARRAVGAQTSRRKPGRR